MRRWQIALTMIVCATLGLAGCTGGTPTGTSGALTIVAPPSLTDAIEGMVHAFTTANPGVQIQTIFEPDSRIPGLTTRSPQPDVIVGEDPQTLSAAGVTTEPVHFAQGQLVLAVPSDNPARLVNLRDLARENVRVALCDYMEPCGQVAADVLGAAVVLPRGTLLYEPDVRSALRHVTEGTADAALVYRSDAIRAGDAVITIEIPESSASLADFVAAVSTWAPNPTIAQSFLDYLSSAPVRDALVRDGFRPPA